MRGRWLAASSPVFMTQDWSSGGAVLGGTKIHLHLLEPRGRESLATAHAATHGTRQPAMAGPPRCARPWPAGTALELRVSTGTEWVTHAEARPEIFEYVEVFYNGQRRHSAAICLRAGIRS